MARLKARRMYLDKLSKIKHKDAPIYPWFYDKKD